MRGEGGGGRGEGERVVPIPAQLYSGNSYFPFHNNFNTQNRILTLQ